VYLGCSLCYHLRLFHKGIAIIALIPFDSSWLWTSGGFISCSFGSLVYLNLKSIMVEESIRCIFSFIETTRVFLWGRGLALGNARYMQEVAHAPMHMLTSASAISRHCDTLCVMHVQLACCNARWEEAWTFVIKLENLGANVVSWLVNVDTPYTEPEYDRDDKTVVRELTATNLLQNHTCMVGPLLAQIWQQNASSFCSWIASRRQSCLWKRVFSIKGIM
jgi:hypothetical protein